MILQLSTLKEANSELMFTTPAQEIENSNLRRLNLKKTRIIKLQNQFLSEKAWPEPDTAKWTSFLPLYPSWSRHKVFSGKWFVPIDISLLGDANGTHEATVTSLQNYGMSLWNCNRRTKANLLSILVNPSMDISCVPLEFGAGCQLASYSDCFWISKVYSNNFQNQMQEKPPMR